MEFGPLEPIYAESDRAKLTADVLEAVTHMPMQALDMKQASVSYFAPIIFAGGLCRLSDGLRSKAHPQACLLASIGIQGQDVDAYVAAIKERELQAGGVCTTACDVIWPAGTLAYRCRTCQSSGNSAICKECFQACIHRTIWCCLLNPSPKASNVVSMRLQAGDHSGHDYALYFSQGGGCCDCGDSAAWSPSGFCHKHSGQTTEEQPQLEPLEAMTLAAVMSWAVYQLGWTLHVCAQARGL